MSVGVFVCIISDSEPTQRHGRPNTCTTPSTESSEVVIWVLTTRWWAFQPSIASAARMARVTYESSMKGGGDCAGTMELVIHSLMKYS